MAEGAHEGCEEGVAWGIAELVFCVRARAFITRAAAGTRTPRSVFNEGNGVVTGRAAGLENGEDIER